MRIMPRPSAVIKEAVKAKGWPREKDKHLVEARINGINDYTYWSRVDHLGWSREKAATTPPRAKKKAGMTRRKVSELEGASLDYAVAKATMTPVNLQQWAMNGKWWPFLAMDASVAYPSRYHPSTNWAQAGPLLDVRVSAVEQYPGESEPYGAWAIKNGVTHHPGQVGGTLLIAICRAIVASELGEEVEIPKALERGEG